MACLAEMNSSCYYSEQLTSYANPKGMQVSDR